MCAYDSAISISHAVQRRPTPPCNIKLRAQIIPLLAAITEICVLSSFVFWCEKSQLYDWVSDTSIEIKTMTLNNFGRIDKNKSQKQNWNHPRACQPIFDFDHHIHKSNGSLLISRTMNAAIKKNSRSRNRALQSSYFVFILCFYVFLHFFLLSQAIQFLLVPRKLFCQAKLFTVEEKKKWFSHTTIRIECVLCT